MTTATTYPALHGGPARAGLAAAAATATGLVEWSRKLELDRPPELDGDAEPDVARGLLIWEGNVVVVSGTSFAAFDASGKPRLRREALRGSSPAAGASGLLYFATESCLLSALDPDGVAVLEDAPLPGVAGDEISLSLLWPRERDFVVAAFWPGRDPEQESYLTWRRAVYEARIGLVGDTIREELLLPPLFVPTLSRLVLAGSTVHSIDVEQPHADTTSFAIPLDEPEEWSADDRGVLCVLGTSHGQRAAVALDPVTGTELWRLEEAGPGGAPWLGAQPPIRPSDARVFVLANDEVLALDRGVLRWRREARGGALHGTALGDGSLLLAAGRTLALLDGDDGRERWSLTLEEGIVAPPVVDLAGNVYVATSGLLVRIG